MYDILPSAMLGGGIETYKCPKGSAIPDYSCHSGTRGCVDKNLDCCANGSSKACPTFATSPPRRPNATLEMNVCVKISEDMCDVLTSACDKTKDTTVCPQIQTFCNLPK
jgi:hypothetical protein